jgi:hypothetical protein
LDRLGARDIFALEKSKPVIPLDPQTEAEGKRWSFSIGYACFCRAFQNERPMGKTDRALLIAGCSLTAAHIVLGKSLLSL